MEIDYNKTDKDDESLSETKLDGDIIQVRAKISCPTCEYQRIFKNQFPRDAVEQMVVSLKIFDWLTCSKCGDLLKLDLEFKI
ncbi:MAG: hypothetical protein EU539_07640 [Promethearchaeota archaeon]|nr:MAG: hypothetical protein EU539_07640 [Candidatus Lokiarchaeota archaeon]